MPFWVAVPLLIAHILLCVKNARAGLVAYLFLAIVAPVTAVGGLTIAYEILAFVPVVAVYFIRGRGISLGLPQRLLVAYFGLLMLSTVVAVVRYTGEIQWFAVIGWVRGIVLTLLLSHALNQIEIAATIGGAVGLNALVVGIQVIFPSTLGIFDNLYYRDSQTAIRALTEMGYFARGTGTFPSPVSLGAVALMGVGVLTGLTLSRERPRWVAPAFFATVIAGIASLSKTFLLGAPLLVAVAVPTALVTGRAQLGRVLGRIGRVILLATPVVVGLVIYVFWRLEQSGVSTEWYLKFFNDPVAAFATRYNASGGNLVETMRVFYENWLIGVGSMQVRAEFLGDSLYVRTLHDGGLLGALFFGSFLVLVLAKLARERDLSGLLLLGAFLISGLAMVIFPNILGVAALAFCLAGRTPKRAAAAASAPLQPTRGMLVAAEGVPSFSQSLPQ